MLESERRIRMFDLVKLPQFENTRFLVMHPKTFDAVQSRGDWKFLEVYGIENPVTADENISVLVTEFIPEKTPQGKPYGVFARMVGMGKGMGGPTG